MPTLAPMAPSTAASREAESNWQKNIAALRVNQPDIAPLFDEVTPELHWVYARDGSLTAMTADGKWWQSCSVPLLAGRAILRSLESLQVSSCLLAPDFAGIIRAAMEGKASVLFVVQPDLEIARVILSCADFSDQIAQHRFWMACGESWSNQLHWMFDEHPGLATPTRFIRTKLSPDDLIASLISAAQTAFSAVATARAERIASLQRDSLQIEDHRQILLVGGSEFHLWDHGPAVLEDQLAGCTSSNEIALHRFDTDAALNGSPLALLHAAAACGSVVSANLCRADCNHLISTRLPWITWITQPAAPAFPTAGPFDALVLADPNWRAIARKAGWPDHRVQVCGWPSRPAANTTGRGLSLICDTQKIEVPPTIKEFSSHRLLWDLIEEELHADPLAVERIDAYLADRAGQLNISMDVLDVKNFVQCLIFPAYLQGLARLFIGEKFPINLWGRGWNDLPEFAAHHRGAISNQIELDEAIADSEGLIYYHPTRYVHPMDAMGKPVILRSGRDRNHLLRRARRILGGAKDASAPVEIGKLGKIICDLIDTAGTEAFRKAG